MATDPPFNIGYEYEDYYDKRAADEYLAWCERWMGLAKLALTPTGTMWVAIGDAFVSELDVLAKRLGFYKRSHVIWYYTFGVNCTQKFTPSHTHLLHYTKHRKKFTFHADKLKVPSAREMIYHDKRAKPGGRLPDDTWVLRPQALPDGFRAREDTWHVPRVAGTFKQRAKSSSNQMPEHVMARIIRACSNEREVVLDPFAGSGTTLAVAKKLGRQHLGFEISKKCVADALKRLEAAREGDDMQGSLPHD